MSHRSHLEKLEADSSGTRSGAVNAPALVLVPGLLCDAAVWTPQLPTLQARTTVQIAEAGLRDSLVSMAEAIIDNAPARFAIAGHSMGGRVALEVIRRVPERVAGLALLDTGCHALTEDAAGAAERRGRRLLVELARSQGMRVMATQWLQGMLHPMRLGDPALVNTIIEMICRRTTAHHAAQIEALLMRPEAGPLLGTISCPALVLCGREDRWSAVPHHQQMAALIPGSQLCIVADCGHMSTLERPEALSLKLCEWLAECR
jgi:pimeloyl-ACP methyl ester carboxylesterase